MFVFFFNDTATTEIYTLSLHDALPISGVTSHQTRSSRSRFSANRVTARCAACGGLKEPPNSPTRMPGDRKSTRLNSSHANISYAVFCLKKKKHIRFTFSFLALLLVIFY